MPTVAEEKTVPLPDLDPDDPMGVPDPTVMRKVYRVESAHTYAVAAVYIADRTYDTADSTGMTGEQAARAHCDRLNDECRRERVMQRGVPMRYEVVEGEAPDDVATVERTIEIVRELRADYAPTPKLREARDAELADLDKRLRRLRGE